MNQRKRKKMDIIPAPKSEKPTLETLSLVPESSVWLANFVSRRTRLTYHRAIRDFVSFSGMKSENDWSKINQAHVIAWRQTMTKKTASGRTINTNLSALSSLFKHLCEHQAATKNPVIGIQRSKVNNDRVQTPVITAQQVRAMLDAPDSPTVKPQSLLKKLRDKALLSTLLYTGSRVAELCSLKVKDFYEDAGYWVLDFTVKGGKKNKVAIHPELKLVLTEYLEFAGHGDEKDSPLLLAIQKSNLRRHLNPSQINRIWYKYSLIASLPKGTTPHTARATFITEALENNCPIEAVQATVGHARVSTTQMYDKRLLKHRQSASLAIQY